MDMVLEEEGGRELYQEGQEFLFGYFGVEREIRGLLERKSEKRGVSPAVEGQAEKGRMREQRA